MINLGICGCGVFVERGVLPLVKDVENVRLIGVFDTSAQQCQRISEQFGIPQIFGSFEKLINCSEIDTVYIASPNCFHKDYTIAAASAGKHVLCEKPMALDADQCGEVIEACRKNDVKLSVGFCYPFGGAQKKAKQLVDEGQIGEVSYMHISLNLADYRPDTVGWRCDPKISGGGPLMDVAPHLVHMGCFFFDDKVESVMAYVRPEKTDSQVEMDVNAIMEFSRGGRVAMDTSFVRGNIDNYTIVGTRGQIHAIGTMGWRAGGTLTLRTHEKCEDIPFGPEEPLAEEFRLFSEAIDRDEDPPVTGEMGMHVQAVIDAIYASARTGNRCRSKQ